MRTKMLLFIAALAVFHLFLTGCGGGGGAPAPAAGLVSKGVTLTGIATATKACKYWYAYTFEWVDNAGIRHISAPFFATQQHQQDLLWRIDDRREGVRGEHRKSQDLRKQRVL